MEFYSGFFSAYTRTSQPISSPLVVHAVAGSGKTSIVREILHSAPSQVAVTYGTPDPVNLSGHSIGLPKPGADIVDEYLAAPDLTGAKLVLADPLQHKREPLRAHFVSRNTKRFGKETCELLQSLGVDIVSELEDTVLFADAYSVDPEGVIIALGQDAVQLLEDHHAEFLRPCQVLGSTYDVVTVLTDAPLEEQDFTDRYIACSRHRTKLLVLS